MKAVVFDDLLWKYLIMRDFYPCCYLAVFSILGKRVWDVLNQENAPMIDLYSQVYAVLSRERLRIVYLVVNIIFSWLSLPYLGILQVVMLFLYYQGIVFA